MFEVVCQTGSLRQALQRCVLPGARKCSTVEAVEESSQKKFDEKMLEFLVCPLSKQPLRYDAENNELVSDTIGVAYPVKNGVPNLVPQDGRMLNSDTPIDTQVKPDSHKS